MINCNLSNRSEFLFWSVSINRRIQKKKNVLEIKINKVENKIVNDFDEGVFTALVDYIVIEGYDATRKKDQFMIRFICETNFENVGKQYVRCFGTHHVECVCVMEENVCV